MSSLMGLQSANARPSWLVGIVPISGYQYDIELYSGNPLPMMAHHGGRDKVVSGVDVLTHKLCFHIAVRKNFFGDVSDKVVDGLQFLGVG